ncbi:unnamed protein product [Ectocarpus sp. CCAP 1310/34]|nr:unnamed protein product [Ectocarpus sp. CCAP 1310/34]
MASFEEAAVVERATGVVRVEPEQEAALGGSSSSRASDQQHERGRECNGGGDNSSPRWTRSHSPLRQLLSSSASSRPGSPKTGNDGLGNGIGGGGGGGSAGGMQPISSLDFAHEEALGVLAGAAANAKPCDIPPSDDIERAAQHEQRPQQPQQQQRVFVKNVLRPVSYDECHIPSEDGQDDGGHDDNVNAGNVPRPLLATVVSSDPVPSVRQPS